MENNGQVVIVTGGSNGIGEATASLFLEHGARVASLDIREPPPQPPEGPFEESRRLDIKCNVSSDAEVKAAVQQVVDKWHTIDILCNVAGITDRSARVAECTDEELSTIMGVDFYGPFYMMRAVIPHFLAKPFEPPTQPLVPVTHRGSIVNVCSVAAVRGGANGAPYTSAKHALLGLSKNTAVGYAKEGIRCNAILPGPVKTNIIAHSQGETLHPDGGPAFQAAGKPLLGFAEPIYIARAIVFLAGAESANGAELQIDDGYLVR